MLPSLRRLAGPTAPSSSSSGAPRRPPASTPRPTTSTHAQRRAAALERQPPITFAAPRRGGAGGEGTVSASSSAEATKGGTKKTLWQSWLSLTPRTRMTMGMAVALFSVTGMMLYKQVEYLVPVPKAQKEASSSDEPHKPRLFAITAVDRKPKAPVQDEVKAASAASSALVACLVLPMAASQLRKGAFRRAGPSSQRRGGPWAVLSARRSARADGSRAFSTGRTLGQRGKGSSASTVYLSRSFSPVPAKATASPLLPSDVDCSPGSADESLSMLLRGGYIRQSSSGIFTFLPSGLKLLKKIETIIAEEMDAIDASRIDMPTLLSNKLWKKSGRDEAMGSELYRLKDRKGGEFVLGPTYEEEVTKLVGGEVHSYKQLPVKVYQMTRKHRDEPRPRMGLLRTREFVMKDMYTFDASIDDAKQSYEEVQGAYKRIMDRLFNSDAEGQVKQQNWRIAQADSGAMGGILSHEYHVEDPAGEDDLLVCSSCSYTANSELAASRPAGDLMPLVSSDVKVRLYSLSSDAVNAGSLLALVSPRNASVNDVKVAGVLRTASAGSNAAGQQIYPIKQGEVHWDWKDRPEGPVVRFSEVKILADHSCSSLSPDDIAEAVEEAVLSYSDPSGQVSSTSDSPRLLDFFPSSPSQEDFLSYHDVRLAESGSGCASCASGTLTQSKAIEVGHTFILGTRYSQSLGYQFAARPEVDAVTGKQKAQERRYFQMGCYGIGVTRLMGVLAMKARRSFLALQQAQAQGAEGVAGKGKSDGAAEPKPGFLWPKHLAPYSHVILLPPSAATQSQKEVETLLARFQSEAEHTPGDAVEEGTVSVLVDDRTNLSMGAKLTEADLTGVGEVWVVGKEGSRRVR